MEVFDNAGALAPIAWNSTGWTAELTAEDIANCGFGHVRETGESADVLNFGHNKYPAEEDGCYYGYAPAFKREVKQKNLVAVFLFSSNYSKANQKYIVGAYVFPQIGDVVRKAKCALYKKNKAGNISALVENIFYFQKPVLINDDLAATHSLLPDDKKLPSRGFAYLNSDNIINILRLANKQNPSDKKLKKIFDQLRTDPDNEEDAGTDVAGLMDGSEVNSLAGIKDLEKKVQKVRPVEKTRLSKYIERGSIAHEVKRITGFKCLLCEAMDKEPIGFIKSNGIPYVEAHHVDPVANLAIGALSVTNIITLCPNHHRQMHYGDVELVKQTETYFTFRVDENKFSIRRVKV